MIHKYGETNFWNETLEELKDNGKVWEDVCWVGTSDTRIELASFKERADFCYDSGFGSEEINLDLLVVGKDWWLERHEYDGAESWEFKSLPLEPEKVNDKIFISEYAPQRPKKERNDK